MNHKKQQMKKFFIVQFMCLLCWGSASIITNPTNVTTCEGSTAVFTCTINDSLAIKWLINGKQILSPPPTTLLNPGPGAQSVISVTATSQLNGATVQCFYNPSLLVPPILSPAAYLSVQAIPTNLITTELSDTSILLAWEPPFGIQTHLTYIVVVTSRNGSVVYNVTVGELQVTINTDPCDQYEGTVSAVLSSCGSRIKIKMPAPSLSSNMTQSYIYLEDNVTVNISLWQKQVCNYTVIVENYPEILKQFTTLGGLTIITLFLPPKKHFKYTITANNAHGSKSVSKQVSTFSVNGITADTAGFNCTYNTDSPAIGCQLNINRTDHVHYHIIVSRYQNSSLNTSALNHSLSAGEYYVEAFDINNSSILSTDEPAVVVTKTLLSPQPTDMPTSASSQFSQAISSTVAGEIGLEMLVAIITIILYLD